MEEVIEKLTTCVVKYIIKKRFNRYVKGKILSLEKQNNHDGRKGHALEESMKLKINSRNEPDIYGFEMKNNTNSKITFIDKSPDKKFFEGIEIKQNDKNIKLIFWNTFKRCNSCGIKIGGWKINKFDINGQCMYVDCNNNICILYNFSHDKRYDKYIRVSDFYKDNKNHTIIIWERESLKTSINNKWNQRGFFICKNDCNGKYNKLLFGKPISFDYWITEVKNNNIYYDGYSSLNGRWRGVFRASNKWFLQHINEVY